MDNSKLTKRIVIGVSGASGHLYTKRLIEVLSLAPIEIFLIFSDDGAKVFTFETECTIDKFLDEIRLNPNTQGKINLLKNKNLFASVASGSFKNEGMVIIPCSMNTAASIANGITSTLLTRVADVMIKEKRPLILLPRETPMNAIHLENLTKLAKLGITILPCMPGFYNKPKTIDDIVNFIVGKTLDALNIDNEIYKRWE